MEEVEITQRVVAGTDIREEYPPCDIVQEQQNRMARYKAVIEIASCPEEVIALTKAYEISRLIFIHHEDVRQRDNMLLEKKGD